MTRPLEVRILVHLDSSEFGLTRGDLHDMTGEVCWAALNRLGYLCLIEEHDGIVSLTGPGAAVVAEIPRRYPPSLIPDQQENQHP